MMKKFSQSTISLFYVAKSWLTLLTAGLVFTVLTSSSIAVAQSVSPHYPDKPITIIVAYAPGGLGDLLARRLSERLAASLKQSILVENKPGATGAIATRFVAKSNPDGYTLLLGQTGEMVINPLVSKNVGYEPSRDFQAVALVGEAPLILVTQANSNIKSLAELIRLVKSNPGTLSYASSGTATPGHLAAAALCQDLGLSMTHIPYKGAGQAMADLMGSHVDVFFSSAAAVLGQIEARNLRALAVSSDKRMPILPQVHSVAEDTQSNFNYTLWGGIFAPKATPEFIVTLLNAEINKVLKDPDFVRQLEKDGVFVKTNSIAQFNEQVNKEMVKYSKILSSLNITAD
jgi:tripartite-type tricarboxylate transporter receptor subunit TctC